MSKNTPANPLDRPQTPRSGQDQPRPLEKYWNERLDQFESSFRAKKAKEEWKS